MTGRALAERTRLAKAGPTPGRPRDAGATEAILATAHRQLEDLGYLKMSMESVASEAGVARSTVYRRFRDKGDLVTAAIAATMPATDPPDVSTDPRQDLIDFVEEFDRRSAKCLVEVLGSLLGSREERATLELHRRRVIGPRRAYARGLLEQACRLGQLRSDTDVDLALEMVVGAVFARQVIGASRRAAWVSDAVDAVWRAWAPCGSSGLLSPAPVAGAPPVPAAAPSPPGGRQACD